MLKSLSFRGRLILIATAPLLALFAIGVVAIWELRETQRAVQTLVDDRVVPMRQLKQVADAFTVDLADQSHKVRDGSVSPDVAIQAIGNALAVADREWRSYLATYLIDDEKALIAQIEPLMAAARAGALHAISLLERRDMPSLDRWAATQLPGLINPLNVKLFALTKVQEQESLRIMAERQHQVNGVLMALAVALVIAMLVAAVLAWLAARQTLHTLRRATEATQALARGEWSHTVPAASGQESGLGMLMAAVDSIRSQLNYSHQQMNALLQVLPVPILAVESSNGKIHDANPAFVSRFELRRDQVVGQALDALPLGFTAESRHTLTRALPELQNGGQASAAITLHSEGGHQHFEISPLLNKQPDTAKLLIAFEDVTQRRAQENALRHAAERDALTGLLNRAGLQAAVDAAWLTWRQQGQGLALVVIDLDGFKPINDQLGHTAGDEVLKEVAQRLNHCLRAGDLPARWGGDEFVLLLSCPHPGIAGDVAHRVRKALQQPINLSGGPRQIGASMGVAHCAEQTGGDAQSLFELADRRMYAAKTAGGNQVVTAEEPGGR